VVVVVVAGGDCAVVVADAVVVDSVADKFSIPETQVAVVAYVFDVVEKIPVGQAQQKYFQIFLDEYPFPYFQHER